MKTGTIGFPSDHQEVAVMDGEGRVVEAGVEGELVTRYVEGKGRSSGIQPPGLKMKGNTSPAFE